MNTNDPLKVVDTKTPDDFCNSKKAERLTSILLKDWNIIECPVCGRKIDILICEPDELYICSICGGVL